MGAQIRQWRSHFHFTRSRIGISLGIAATVVAVFIASSRVPALRNFELWAIILGILLTGMVLTPGLPGIVFRCLFHGNWRWWRGLRPWMGIPLLILLTAWWVVLAGQATQWKLISDMVGTHFLNRAFGPALHAIGINVVDATPGGSHDPMRSYAQPPGFYLATIWATFWPWSILLIPTAFHTYRRLRGRTPIAIDQRPYQLLVAWIIPMWIGLELSRGKLLHYPLPLFVPMAILCADTLVQSWNRMTDVLAAEWFQKLRWGVLGVWLVMGLTLLIASHLHGDEALFWRCLPFAAGLIATGIVGTATWGRPSWPYVLVLAWGGSLLVADVVLLSEMPELNVSRIAATSMRHVQRQRPETQFGVLGYEEATLAFYTGKNVRRFNVEKELARVVPFGPERDPNEQPYAIVISEAFRKKLGALGLQYETLTRLDLPENLHITDVHLITGFNAANFKPVNVVVITNIIPPPATTSSATTLPESAPKP
jgi:4-amino-4-deoxy-L-arabinose transferase-like glycosyltransferase